jgi:protein-disulfide isomerase
MRIFAFVLLLSFLCFAVSGISAQNTSVLASANGKNYTAADLDPETRGLHEGLSKFISEERVEILGEMIAQILFATEAAAKNMTVEKLLETEVTKRMTAPTAAEIQAVYDANKESIGTRTLAEVRPQIVQFLEREAYPKAAFKYVGELKAKHKVVMGKDVNAAALLPTDVLATVVAKTITAKQFEEKAGPTLYDVRMSVYERTLAFLEGAIYTELIGLEAQKTNVSASEVIAAEITNKMKDYSEEEREGLENAFYSRLRTQYRVSFNLKEPAAFVQKISVDDDPSVGPAAAPVTVVMFTDFQCPACAATHPVLKKVLAGYGNKVRLVVRDYPLTQVHANAYKAAQAANAANAQGKFFEYVELLYDNQTSLDPASLKQYASTLQLDRTKFDADLDSGKFAVEVNKDMIEGDAYGINSTPTIFVNGIKVRSLSASGFRRAIDRALSK